MKSLFFASTTENLKSKTLLIMLRDTISFMKEELPLFFQMVNPFNIKEVESKNV